MGKWFAVAVKWLMKHPEVVQVVADAVMAHADAKK